MARPVWNIAHRGASHHAPENTLEAFRLALEQGANGVELDVRLRADGVVVVHHDADLTRTAGRQQRVASLTADELGRVEIGLPGRDSLQRPGIPRLEQVVAALPRSAILDVELKDLGGSNDRLARAALRVAGGRPGPTWFTSSTPEALERLRASSAEASLGLILRRATATADAMPLAGRLGIKVLIVRRNVVDDELLARAAEAHLPVLPYSVEDAEETRWMVRHGVAGILTRRPDLVARTLAEMGCASPPPDG